MIDWLDDVNPIFPALNKALKEPNGLLAAGGNLEAQTLLLAYQQGIFPWYEPPDPILWWSPDPRCVLLPEQLHVSRSMRKTLSQSPFRLSCDKVFSEVMQACAAPRSYTDRTWISAEMLEAYSRLHQLGYAHSIEVWQDDELVGGLYGIALGGAFFGESMFSRRANASKFGFIHLAQTLFKAGFSLIDCQVSSPHMLSLGAADIRRRDFQLTLEKALTVEPSFSPWDALNS